MRWESLITASSEGDRSAEITVHMTDHEAAILTLALENLIHDAFGNGPEITEWYGFGPAHYAAIESLIQWLEGASSMTREQFRRVNWWETFGGLDAKEWRDLAPRCDWPRFQVSELGSPPEIPPLMDAELDSIMQIIDPAGILV